MSIATNCDASVYDNYPDTNWGTSGLRVQSHPNENVRTYIKFPISVVPASIDKVTLRLYHYLGAVARTFEIRRVTGSWTETGITWNTQPVVTDINKIEFAPITAIGWEEVDITNMFNDETGSTFSVQIKDKTESDSGSRYYYWREYSGGRIGRIEFNTRYVKTTGNDALDGRSWVNAWKTINKAATTAPDGSTVHIGVGTYNAEPAGNKIAPQNIGASGIEYTIVNATTGLPATGSVIVEKN